MGHTLADAGHHHIGCRAAQRTGTLCITRSRWPLYCRTPRKQMQGGSWSQESNASLIQNSWISTHMFMATLTPLPELTVCLWKSGRASLQCSHVSKRKMTTVHPGIARLVMRVNCPVKTAARENNCFPRGRVPGWSHPETHIALQRLFYSFITVLHLRGNEYSDGHTVGL